MQPRSTRAGTGLRKIDCRRAQVHGDRWGSVPRNASSRWEQVPAVGPEPTGLGGCICTDSRDG